MSSNIVSASDLKDLLHAELMKLVTESVRRDRQIRDGQISPSDAVYDLKLDVEDFFEKSSNRLHTHLVVTKKVS